MKIWVYDQGLVGASVGGYCNGYGCTRWRSAYQVIAPVQQSDIL